MRHLKGERRQHFLDPGSDPIVTPRGPIVLCPISIFRLLRSKAVSAGATKVAQCNNKQLLFRLDHLCDRVQVQQEEPGHNRWLYSTHSTQVGAVCCLLQAGFSETIINTLANWSLGQMRRYTNLPGPGFGVGARFTTPSPLRLPTVRLPGPPLRLRSGGG